MRTVLENGIREIAGEVRNSLDFHRSQEGGGEVAQVVLSGAALDIPGFAEALQAALGVEVARETVGVADGARRRADLPAPAGGRRRPGGRGGAAMRAVNLIPAERARRRRHRRRALRRGRLRRARPARRCWRCSRCSTASPATRSPAASGEAATLTAKAQRAQARAAALAPYTSFAAMREQRVQAVETLVDSRFDWAHAFHELGRVLPPQASRSPR